MNWITLLTLTPILVILFYIAIAVFIIWFTLKVLNNQKAMKGFLKDISDKLEQKD